MRAAAAPGCGSAPAGTAARVSPPAGPPWAQRLYQPQRLAGIADGTGVLVAVLDSGVDGDNPLLRGRVLAGTDELDGGDGRLDCVGHGTAVASIIAAVPAPATDLAFAGLAPRARILPLRVTEQEIVGGTATGRPGSLAGLVAAVRWAVAHGARVLNLSLVLYQDTAALREAIEDALRHDVVVVAAVGNGHGQASGPDPTPYPAGYPGVIGVGAIGPDGQRLADSPAGDYVDLVAPGGDVTAAGADRTLVAYRGTSFAAPFVSATAALIRQRDPTMSAAEVSRRILASADPAPDGQPSGGYGHGILDPYRAVTGQYPVAAQPGRSPLPAPVAPRASGADRTGTRAAVLATGGAALLMLLLLAVAIVRRGSRRGWRPGG